LLRSVENSIRPTKQRQFSPKPIGKSDYPARITALRVADLATVKKSSLV